MGDPNQDQQDEQDCLEAYKAADQKYGCELKLSIVKVPFPVTAPDGTSVMVFADGLKAEVKKRPSQILTPNFGKRPMSDDERRVIDELRNGHHR